jgi:hypothetical protein
MTGKSPAHDKKVLKKEYSQVMTENDTKGKLSFFHCKQGTQRQNLLFAQQTIATIKATQTQNRLN